MKIRQAIGRSNEFIVTAQAGDGVDVLRPHVVVLDAFGGVGMCDCRHWDFRIRPRLEKLSPGQCRSLDNPNDHRCKHVLAARAWLDERLARLSTLAHN
jgi:hypothetical protein